MIKAILFDVDGVIVNTGFFSERLSSEYNIPMEKILPFFKGTYRECQLGKTDLKDKLKDFILATDYPGTTDELLEYWFSDIKPNLNTQLINDVELLREKGIKCGIATNQESNRASYLWNEASLNKYFDTMFASYNIGFRKPAPAYFENIVKTLGLKPEEILIVDSDPEIVGAAQQFGFDSFTYTSFDEYKHKLTKYL